VYNFFWSTGKPYPDQIVSGQIATLLVAGYDTSSWTSVWALYDIARHPRIQQRIAQELADAGLLQVRSSPFYHILCLRNFQLCVCATSTSQACASLPPVRMNESAIICYLEPALVCQLFLSLQVNPLRLHWFMHP